MKNLLRLIGAHDFRPYSIEGDGGTYLEWRRCGKVDDSVDPTATASSGPFGNGG